jgi:hypothetical protein
MESHSSPNQIPPFLGAEVFRYFDAQSPESLSSFVELLVANRDIASLQAGLDAGVLDGLRVHAAVNHCANVLIAYADKAISSDTAQAGQAELKLAKDWIQRRVQHFGSTFTEQILHHLINRVSQQYFLPILDLLKQPQFGLDLMSDLCLTEEQAKEYGDTDPRYSLLGRIGDSYSSLALDLLGSTADRFPDSTALPPQEHGKLWVALNLAEQAVFFSSIDQDMIQRLLSMVAPDSCAQRQLGELAFMLLLNQDDDFLRNAPAGLAHLVEKSDRLIEDREATVRAGLAFIGAGVKAPDKDSFWRYVRESTTYIAGHEGSDITGDLPLAHAVLHKDPDTLARDVGAKALVRMLREGGVSIFLKDPNGRTFLEAAASIGHIEAVEMLLKLEADPVFDVGSDYRKDAAAAADENGHALVAQMIRAHEAQNAVASVLTQHRFNAFQP